MLASGHGAELGRLGLSVLLQAGTPTQIFQWLDRTRAAALIAVQPTRAIGIDDDLAALRSVQLELATLKESESETPSANNSAVAALLQRQTAIENQIRRATWVSRSTVPPERDSTSPAVLRRLLDDRILVEFGVLDGNLLAVVLSAPPHPPGPARTAGGHLARCRSIALRAAPALQTGPIGSGHPGGEGSRRCGPASVGTPSLHRPPAAARRSDRGGPDRCAATDPMVGAAPGARGRRAVRILLGGNGSPPPRRACLS